ncbi:36630_t:CDS:2 [Gigaspora margarita]|uniref:36630_t:CDS:1 n=1 Tax=Gigaspora margarita TaxID=4874 RepID=A0ABN7UJ75_GIGMA|nr:36630_t:CDS:2 [Gigaspora margarita]
MSETKYCEACQTTNSAKFRSLGGEMWKKAVNNGLVKKDWEEDICLCNICYINVKNPLDKLSKQAKNTNIDEDAENELSEAIKMLAKFFIKENIWPLERSSQTIDRMKKLMLFICYLLASLHNSKINVFKFNIANYLDSVGTRNKGINMMAKLGITLTARSVNHNKRRTSNAHEEYVGVA